MGWTSPSKSARNSVRRPATDRCRAARHDHYDHMDLATLSRLRKEHNPAFITGLGNGKRLQLLRSSRVIELDWWQEKGLLTRMKLVCVPAQHFSGRTPFDRDTTLWCGFVLVPPPDAADGGAIFFAADTGFGPALRDDRKEVPKPEALDTAHRGFPDQSRSWARCTARREGR